MGADEMEERSKSSAGDDLNKEAASDVAWPNDAHMRALLSDVVRTVQAEQFGRIEAKLQHQQDQFESLRDQLRADVEAIRSEVGAAQKSIADLNAVVEELSHDMKQTQRELSSLRARVSDMDSLSRTYARAGRFAVAPLSMDVAPRGGAFRESDSDFRPFSPFAQ
jgi:outer membrane murein-binding lipoprotein Lpp